MVAAVKGIKGVQYRIYDPLRFTWSSSLIIKRILIGTIDPLRRGSRVPKGIKGIIWETMISFAAVPSLVSPSFTLTDALSPGRGVGPVSAPVGTSGASRERVTRNPGLRLATENNSSVSFPLGGPTFEK